MKKPKPKYKAGDVLTTKLGNLFTIIGIRKEKNPSRYSQIVYDLKGHKGYNYLPVEYIDSSTHISLATKAGKLLFLK